MISALTFGETAHQGGEKTVVLVGVHHPGEGGLDAAEKRGEHRADEQHIQHVVVCFLKEVAVDHRGGKPHNYQVHGKGGVGVDGQDAPRARHEHHRRMDEGVQGVHPQQAGGNNGVVYHRLEHQRRPANGKSRNEHDDELGDTEAHGVVEVLGVDVHQQIGGAGGKGQESHHPQLQQVGAVGGASHRPLPPSSWETAEAQAPLWAAPRRMAFLPCLSR